MKKLITMIVAATAIAFGARPAAATTYSSVNFDSLTADTDYDALYADSQDPEDASAFFWVDGNGAQFEASTVIGTVRAYAEASGGNVNYLELDTDAVVQRRAKADGTGTSMGSIFVDTLVQFTPSDEDAECSVSATDKIAIWMQEKNIDSSDPELLPVTNLLVCAGAGDVGNAATNYVIAGTWEAGKWYRLVIKSGATAANGNPGFVIFIDGNKIADVNGVEVFPSLVTTGDAATTISHLGFNGTGAVDELVFTDEDPCPEVKFFTINWDSNVANIQATYTDGYLDTQVTTNLSAGTTETLVLPPTGGTITITTTLASGYGFRSTASNCTYSDGTITVAANAIDPSFTITPYSENFFVGENSYENFTDAVTAAGASGGTIKLGKNVVIPYDDQDKIPGGIFLDSGSWIIDLAGNTLTGNYDASAVYKATIVNGGCDLIITNSTVQVGSVVGGTYEFEETTHTGDSLCILGGETTIYGGIFENFVDVDPEGDLNFMLAVKGGSYGDNGDAAGFELEDYVDLAVYQIADSGGYVVVSQIPNYTVTLPAAPANSTWSVTVEGSPVSGVNNVYEVSDGDTLVATLTADEGYLFSDGTTSKVYAFEDIDADINATSLIELPTVATPKAKIGTTIYLTLTDALNDAAAGETVELLDDVVVDSTVAINQNQIIDLGGHSLSNTTVRSGETVARTLQANAGNVVVTNGTVYGRVNCYDSSTLTVAANTTVEGFVLVWGDGTYGEQGCLTPTFNLYGTINNAGEDNAIKTGTPDGSMPVINIYDGAVINYDGAYTAVVLNDGATLTMQGGTLNAGSAGAGIGLWEGASFTMTGGDITTGSFGVFNNGMVQDATTMAISGGTVTSTNGNACAVYQAGPGALTLSGTAVISGPDAVEVRAGTVQVLDNAQLIATAPYSAPQSNGGGNSGHGGVALIVSQHTTAQNVSATVSGGTLTGEVAFVEATLESQNDPTKVGGSITGGTLYGDIETEDIAGFISGGTFDQPLDPELCAEGFVPADNGSGSYGVDYGYTITYVSAYGDAPAAKDVTVGSLGAAYTLVAADLPEMVVAGLVFNGWGKAVDDTISADTTLRAQWATANYTITLPAAAANTSWYVEADGVEVVPAAGVYTVAAGADVVVYSKADAGYLFENGTDTKTVYTFEDIAASQDKSADAAPAPAAAKAKIGTVLYLSLSDAVSGAADGDVVELLGNVTIDARVEPNVGANTELTIDLGGYTIARTGTSGNGSAFDVKSGNVVITNGVIDCTQDDTAIAKDGVYAITSRSGSNVTLADLTITVDSECGACAYPFAGSTMTIESGTYANVTTTPYRYNTAITGMAVNQPNNSTQNLIINGGSFSQYDPQLGDDSGLMTDFTDDGFVAIQDGSGNWVVQAGYNVTFDAGVGAPAPDAQRVAAGGTATAPTAPTAEGYTFNGWKLNDAAYDFSTVLSGDITLVADWTAVPVPVVLNLEGSGTAVDPYLITNLADLKNFRDWVNDGNDGAGQYFKVTAATIDLASESPWTPIGSKSGKLYFNGEFDGNGVVINNFTHTTDYGGLFGAVSNAVLKSFTLGTSSVSGIANAAAVCGYTEAGSDVIFSNIVNNVSVSGTSKVAGFTVQLNGNCQFIDCVNNGTITGPTGSQRPAGGFVAMYNEEENSVFTFTRCVNNGTIAAGKYSGGLVAYVQKCFTTAEMYFVNCTNNAAINGVGNAGGFIGRAGGSSPANAEGSRYIVNCANYGEIIGGNEGNFIGGYNGNGNDSNLSCSGKNTMLTEFAIVESSGKEALFQAKKGWLWNAKIVGETYTTLYSDLATAIADAAGETLVIAADSTLSNSFDIDGTVTIGSGIAVSGGNLRVNSGTLAITGGTFTDVALAEAGTGEITITGGTFNADPTGFVADGYEAVEEGGLYTVQLAAPPAGKWDSVEADSITGVTAENKEAVEATLNKLETALGSVSDVETWISTVYGTADVPAAKLAATTDALIAISLAYDLPILEGEPAVDVAATTTTTGKAAFTFTFTDDGDPVSVQAEKALQLIKYSATVNGEFAYTPAKFVVTAVTSENGNVLKAEFVGADAAGYGKVDFTVPAGE